MGVQKTSFADVRSSDTFILVAMCFALFTDTFVYGIIVPILPYLLLDHGGVTSNNVQKWTSLLLASYGGALLVGSPIVGFLCDRYRSRKLPLIFGFVAIALATILFMCARNPWLLLVARVCQGLSGAVVGVLGLTLIAETATQEHLGAYMAYGSMALTWGMLCGPMVGGFLFAKFGNAGAFGTPIALLVVDIVLRLLVIEKKNNGKTPASDAPLKPTPQEDSPLLERDMPSGKTLSFYHYLHPILLAVMFAVITASSVLSAFETTLPLYVMETYNWSSVGAGLIFLPLTLPSILSIPVGHHAGRLGPRNVVTTGFFLTVGPMIALRWTQVNTLNHTLLLCFLLFIIGCCMMTVQALTMAEVSNAVRKIEARHGLTEAESSGQGRGYAFCNMAFAGGQFLGPMLGGMCKSGLGWGFMTLILGVMCLAAGIPAFFFTSATPEEEEVIEDAEEAVC